MANAEIELHPFEKLIHRITVEDVSESCEPLFVANPGGTTVATILREIVDTAFPSQSVRLLFTIASDGCFNSHMGSPHLNELAKRLDWDKNSCAMPYGYLDVGQAIVASLAASNCGEHYIETDRHDLQQEHMDNGVSRFVHEFDTDSVIDGNTDIASFLSGTFDSDIDVNRRFLAICGQERYRLFSVRALFSSPIFASVVMQMCLDVEQSVCGYLGRNANRAWSLLSEDEQRDIVRRFCQREHLRMSDIDVDLASKLKSKLSPLLSQHALGGIAGQPWQSFLLGYLEFGQRKKLFLKIFASQFSLSKSRAKLLLEKIIELRNRCAHPEMSKEPLFSSASAYKRLATDAVQFIRLVDTLDNSV